MDVLFTVIVVVTSPYRRKQDIEELALAGANFTLPKFAFIWKL